MKKKIGVALVLFSGVVGAGDADVLKETEWAHRTASAMADDCKSFVALSAANQAGIASAPNAYDAARAIRCEGFLLGVTAGAQAVAAVGDECWSVSVSQYDTASQLIGSVRLGEIDPEMNLVAAVSILALRHMRDGTAGCSTSKR